MARKANRKLRRKPQNFWLAQFRLLRFYLVTGLMVWVPLIVTIWITWWLFTKVGVGLENVIRDLFGFIRRVTANVPWLDFFQEIRYRPGMGFGSAVALFLLTGILTRYIVGRRFITYGERILDKIPFIRTVYRAVQQIRDTFVNREGMVFQKVCLIEFPRKGMYTIGFITCSEPSVAHQAIGSDFVAVFMPTTPNPTTGFLMYTHPSEVKVLDVSIEDAMKMIISAGAYIPKKIEAKLDTEEDNSGLEVSV